MFMRALRLIWSIVSWTIPILMLVAVIYYVRSQPLAAPPEIKESSVWVVAIGAPLSAYFFWRIKGSRSTFDLYTVFNYIRAVAFTHLGVLWYCSAQFGWWDDGQGQIANAALYDTFLNGVFFNFFGSYQINFSNFEPDNQLRVWQSIMFVFGALYTFILPAVLFAVFKSQNQKNTITHD